MDKTMAQNRRTFLKLSGLGLLTFSVVVASLAYTSRIFEVTTNINASASQVWKILSDLETWQDWNRLNPGGSGTPVVGQTLMLNTLAAPDKISTAKAKMIEYEAERTFRWTGGLPIPGLYRIEHWFLLEPQGESACLVTHGEKHQGLLVSMILKPFGADFERYYRDTNAALKVQAEGAISP
jgi:hypothetical protein